MNREREAAAKRKEEGVAFDKEYLITKKEEQLLDTNSKLCRQISYQYQFRKRTFKSDQIMKKNENIAKTQMEKNEGKSE